jgi:hypothetical protein
VEHLVPVPLLALVPLPPVPVPLLLALAPLLLVPVLAAVVASALLLVAASQDMHRQAISELWLEEQPLIATWLYGNSGTLESSYLASQKATTVLSF